MGLCDNCGNNTFITRSDDNEEIIKKRLSIFHSENDAIVNYYKGNGVLVDISCEGSVNEISHNLSSVIDGLKVKVRI
jgi:adenylate kinase